MGTQALIPELINLLAPKQKSSGQDSATKQSSTQTSSTTQTKTQTEDKWHKNPLFYNTFEERGQAIAAKLDRIRTNKNYQKLTPEQQSEVRRNLYHKYVVPSYQGFKKAIPDEKTWVAGSAVASDINKVSSYKKPNDVNPTAKGYREFSESLGHAADAAAGNINIFGLKTSNYVLSKMHDVAKYFTHGQENLVTQKLASRQKEVTNELRIEQNRVNSNSFWLETHPRDTMISKLGSLAGESIVQLPFWEAMGETKTGQLIADSKLGARLAESPIGRWTANRLIKGTEAFLVGLTTSGGDVNEATKTGLVGSMFPGPIKKIASAPLIKKWTANTIAMGGKPLAEEIANTVAYEGKIPHDIIISKESTYFGNGIAIHPNPESPNTGHFFYDGKQWAYNNPQERQSVYSHIEKMAEAKRIQEDPLLGKLIQAEKSAQESIAQAKYGKSLNELTIKELKETFAERGATIEQAAAEAPVHLPELNKQEIEHNWNQQIQQNPELKKRADRLKALGIDVVDIFNEHSINQVAEQTGIKSQPKAAKNIGNSGRIALGELEKKYPKAAEELQITPKRFAQLKADYGDMYKRINSRLKVGEGVGKRSKENLKDFISTLKEEDKGAIHFEDPYHRMLFHWGNRKQLPDEVRSQFLRQLKKIKPESKAADFDKAADWLHSHLLTMAESGRLVEEGNIYRSTKLGGPQQWTKWQWQLQSEVDEQELEVIRKSLKRHPEALKAVESFWSSQQKLRFSADSPEAFIEADKKLKKILADTVTYTRSKIIGKEGSVD